MPKENRNSYLTRGAEMQETNDLLRQILAALTKPTNPGPAVPTVGAQQPAQPREGYPPLTKPAVKKPS